MSDSLRCSSSKLKRRKRVKSKKNLSRKLITIGDESYAGGSLSMKSGIRKGRSETCLSRLRKVFSNDSGRARKYAKVIDENEI